MAPDDLLGRSFTFYDTTGGTEARRETIVIGYDPVRGWRLAGNGFEPTFVPFTLWHRLIKEGVLVPR